VSPRDRLPRGAHTLPLASRSQRRVVRGVALVRWVPPRLDLGLETRAVFVQVAGAHRLVTRGVRSQRGPVRGPIADLDHAPRARPAQDFDNQRPARLPMDVRKSRVVRTSGGSSPPMARKARLRSPADAIRRLAPTPTEDESTSSVPSQGGWPRNAAA